MALDFPNSPSLNDTYTSSGRTWQWNGTVWEAVTTGISANSISTTDLADDAVTTAKIQNSAITTAKIAAGAVVEADIADSAVTATKLATDAVTTAKIQNSAVTVTKLATTAQPGLVLIKTQTIGNAVSSVSVTDVFSADYDNYKIIINGVDSSIDETVYHMKLSGSTGSTYSSAIKWTALSTGTMSGTQLSASSTGWIIGLTDIDGAGNAVIDVISPFLTTRTTCTYQGAESGYMIIGGGYDTNSASHTGFTIHAPTSNTLTGGTIRVYGYRNS